MNPRLGLRLVARARVRIGGFLEAGPVDGGQRRVIPLAGGSVDGPEIVGEVLPLGADWNLVRRDGSETVSARYLIRTHDDVLLSVQNEGVIAGRAEGRRGITALRIEAPAASDYAWLNDAVLVGSLTVDDGAGEPVVVLEYWCAEAVPA
jgi:hypothetical protein